MLDKIAYESGVQKALAEFGVKLAFGPAPVPFRSPMQVPATMGNIRAAPAPVAPGMNSAGRQFPLAPAAPAPGVPPAPQGWWNKTKAMASSVASHPMGQMGAMMVGGPIIGNMVNRMMEPSRD